MKYYGEFFLFFNETKQFNIRKGVLNKSKLSASASPAAIFSENKKLP
jgi:hypothetical protein